MFYRARIVKDIRCNLMFALVDHKRLPKFPQLDDEVVQARLEEATQAIIALHREFGMRHV